MSELKDKNGNCSPEDQFFGAVTVGERGQVVIPAEARKQMGINPGDKLLAMEHPFGSGLVLIKADQMRKFLSGFLEGLTGAEQSLQEAEAVTPAPENV